MKDIRLRTTFTGWRQITKEKLLEYAKWKFNNMTLPKTDEEKLSIINKNIDGFVVKISDIK